MILKSIIMDNLNKITNSIPFENGIYDIKEKKIYPLKSDLHLT
jgi:hypothetical protein